MKLPRICHTHVAQLSSRTKRRRDKEQPMTRHNVKCGCNNRHLNKVKLHKRGTALEWSEETPTRGWVRSKLILLYWDLAFTSNAAQNYIYVFGTRSCSLSVRNHSIIQIITTLHETNQRAQFEARVKETTSGKLWKQCCTKKPDTYYWNILERSIKKFNFTTMTNTRIPRKSTSQLHWTKSHIKHIIQGSN